MAEDQLGTRQDGAPKTPWTKIFSTFKVALDLKKLLLAAAGILVMALGWWVISEIFFFLGGTTPPLWKDYKPPQGTAEEIQARFESFKLARQHWNLRYKLAGRPSGDKPYEIDVADIALHATYQEYEALETIAADFGVLNEVLQIKSDPGLKTTWIAHGSEKYLIVPVREDDKSFEEIKEKSFQVRETRLGNEKEQTIIIGKTEVKIGNADNFAAFKKLRQRGKELADLERDIEGKSADYRTALILYKRLVSAKSLIKPYGQLRTMPWFENRGPNPYLTLTSRFKEPVEAVPGSPRTFGQTLQEWFLGDQAPVLLEPLFKFLRPVTYLFESNAGFWNRFYLLFIILWTILTWAYFGGAICRMASVQLARNEKIGLRESLGFARSRCRSLFFAPFLPLLFMALLTFFLIIFGTLIGHTYFFGDIFLVPILFPVVLVFGLIMAVVLVGLIGYPLMNPTIATEGTDSFDALSRSYSYVYQAPWHYLWYSFLAILYGAVLIFFVGLMGSLMVYLGKWGLSQAPFLSSAAPLRDREPQYLFVWAPTSFGWRDLLISDSAHAVREVAVSPGGVVTSSYHLSEAYMAGMSIPNYIGAVFVTFWIYLFFLLVVGFGYSYFWTASSLIYLLMRRHVDETDLDEVYLEDEEGPDAFPQDMTAPKPAPSAPAPGGSAPGGGLQMVDSPMLRTVPEPAPSLPIELPTTPAPTPPTPTTPTPTPTPPPSSPSLKHTQLAPSSDLPDENGEPKKDDEKDEDKPTSEAP